MKPFGIVTNIAVEFYQIAHRTCCPIQSQSIPREVPDARGWGCPGASGCLLLDGAMGWVLAARPCLAAPMGSPRSPGHPAPGKPTGAGATFTV